MSAPPGNAPTSVPARPAIKRTNTDRVDPALLRMMVGAYCVLEEAAGHPVRRKVARQIILGRLGAIKSPDELLRFARNELGIVDPTGTIAVHNVMRCGAK